MDPRRYSGTPCNSRKTNKTQSRERKWGRSVAWDAGASFQLFLGGPKIILFFNATELLKNWKKQHFICSNLTLFIVPFFISFFFSSFFLFFLFFLSFFFFLGGDGPPAPLKWRPWWDVTVVDTFAASYLQNTSVLAGRSQSMQWKSRKRNMITSQIIISLFPLHARYLVYVMWSGILSLWPKFTEGTNCSFCANCGGPGNW